MSTAAQVPVGGDLSVLERVVVPGPPDDPSADHEVVLRRWGQGAPEVVLVHGIGVSHRYLVPLARELADGASVVAPDLPGFGLSPRSDRPLTIEQHAEVLAAVLDRLGTAGAVLVGHSMGAQVVTEVAVRRPDLVARLVLLGAVAEPCARNAARLGLRLLRDTVFESRQANWLMVHDWLRCGPRWYLATVAPMVGYPLDERLARVTAPVVLARGVHDPVAPLTYLEGLAAVTRQGEVHEVAGEGHIAMFRRPAEVARWCRPDP